MHVNEFAYTAGCQAWAKSKSIHEALQAYLDLYGDDVTLEELADFWTGWHECEDEERV